MTEEEQIYADNLQILVTARTEQLRTAMRRIEELERQLAELQKTTVAKAGQ